MKDKSEESLSLPSRAVRNAQENLPLFFSSFLPVAFSQILYVISEALTCILGKRFFLLSRNAPRFPSILRKPEPSFCLSE